MNFASVLYDIIILPIESIIEFIFCFVLDKFSKFGVAGAIVAVSLVVNFLALPIYNVADEIQLKERELQKKMTKGIARIKQAFSGDERFMMLNTYYRQNNYHPLYALRQSLSILIEVPFFIAAYHFLSHCSLLENQSILFLKDLSKPDAFIHLTGGGMGDSVFTLNLLPILMTAINVVSSIIYTKGAPIREKMQTFVLAGIFLVLLYNSPSGLVFYWVLNQIFSLCKNIVKKLKHPIMVVYAFLSTVLIAISGYLILFRDNKFSAWKCAFYFLTLFFIACQFIWRGVSAKNVLVKLKLQNLVVSEKYDFYLLLLSCVSLCLLCGLVLPSNVIATSPAEFSFLGNTDSPLAYILSSLVFFAGLFVFWPLVIYKMFGDNKIVKIVMPPFFFVLVMCALANAFVFKHNYNEMNIFFKLQDDDIFEVLTPFFTLLPLLFMAAIIALMVFAKIKGKVSSIISVPVVLLIAELVIGSFNVVKINRGFNEYKQKTDGNYSAKKELLPEFGLSCEHNNVAVLFLDRAISDFFPIVIEQFPELKESFSGFVYYPNCLSLGESTLSASPSLMGGYEYSPEEINKRSDEKLVDKHNESLLVMPTIFAEAGYNVALADPPWMNYEGFFYEGGLFSKLPNTKVFPLQLRLGSNYIVNNKDDFSMFASSDVACSVCSKYFSVLQILYPPFRENFYRRGSYFISPEKSGTDKSVDYYAELYYLPELTDFSSDKPSFMFLSNETTHEYGTVIKLESRPIPDGDNSECKSTVISGGPYKANALALIQVGKWLDYLKENGCYDNTRIIIVSDHGRVVQTTRFDSFTNVKDANYFNPLLIVKDFNVRGAIVADNSLVTNADTVNFAIKDLGIKPENPFTKKKFSCAGDFSSFNVYEVFAPGYRNAFDYKKLNQFPLDPKRGYTVRDNVFDESNWTRLDVSDIDN